MLKLLLRLFTIFLFWMLFFNSPVFASSLIHSFEKKIPLSSNTKLRQAKSCERSITLQITFENIQIHLSNEAVPSESKKLSSKQEVLKRSIHYFHYENWIDDCPQCFYILSPVRPDKADYCSNLGLTDSSCRTPIYDYLQKIFFYREPDTPRKNFINAILATINAANRRQKTEDTKTFNSHFNKSQLFLHDTTQYADVQYESPTASVIVAITDREQPAPNTLSQVLFIENDLTSDLQSLRNYTHLFMPQNHSADNIILFELLLQSREIHTLHSIHEPRNIQTVIPDLISCLERAEHPTVQTRLSRAPKDLQAKFNKTSIPHMKFHLHLLLSNQTALDEAEQLMKNMPGWQLCPNIRLQREQEDELDDLLGATVLPKKYPHKSFSESKSPQVTKPKQPYVYGTGVKPKSSYSRGKTPVISSTRPRPTPSRPSKTSSLNAGMNEKEALQRALEDSRKTSHYGASSQKTGFPVSTDSHTESLQKDNSFLNIKKQGLGEALKSTESRSSLGHVLIISGPPDFSKPRISSKSALEALDTILKQECSFKNRPFDIIKAMKDGKKSGSLIIVNVPRPEQNALHLGKIILVPANRQKMEKINRFSAKKDYLKDFYLQISQCLNGKSNLQMEQQLFVSPIGTGGNDQTIIQMAVDVCLDEIKLMREFGVVNIICHPTTSLASAMKTTADSKGYRERELQTRRNRRFASSPTPKGTPTDWGFTAIGHTTTQDIRMNPLTVVTLPPGIKVTLLPPIGDYSEIYANKYSVSKNMASVNAGDQGLYVGGGTINLQFERDLATAQRGLLHREYRRYHQSQINRKQLRTIIHDDNPSIRWLQSSTTYYDELCPGTQNATGTVFIDVFNDNSCPHGNRYNRAMVYVVPPKGTFYKNLQDFLKAVEQTAENIVIVLNAHNQHRPYLAIPTLRVCGFSAGQFLMPGVSASNVHNAINSGLVRGLSNSSTIEEIQFPYGMTAPSEHPDNQKGISDNRDSEDESFDDKWFTTTSSGFSASGGKSLPPQVTDTIKKQGNLVIISDDGDDHVEDKDITDSKPKVSEPDVNTSDDEISLDYDTETKRSRSPEFSGFQTSPVFDRRTSTSPKEKPVVSEDSLEKEAEDCPICMCTLDNPKTLPCKHTFCTKCINEYFANYKPVCPNCNAIYGIVTGIQPTGTMKITYATSEWQKVTSAQLHPQGKEEKIATWVIQYTFKDGVQGEEHPNPGTHYTGFKEAGHTRTAYIPNTPQGNEILELLKIAFIRKMTFTIDRSRTTGEDNMVTWNEIHHKTSTNPANQHGYKDSWLHNVLDELKVKGITPESITDEEREQIRSSTLKTSHTPARKQ
ncbi:hypothetical protein CI610_00419 [invertebrate metagenome]|uniref:RING-type E3 ubiquitin transferase n=1 Tax=invertebrate metagenome TaxID=1711999 RepID=A0A2H9TBM1_9ZZZZ